LSKNDPGKLIVSVGAGGFDWDEFEGRKNISTPAAWALLDRSHATFQFDGRSLNPNFNYRDIKGHRHEVWFLDASTAFNQLKAALPYKPAGVAFSRLGHGKVKALEKASTDRIVRWLHWNAPTLAIYPEISSELNESETLALLASPPSRLRIIPFSEGSAATLEAFPRPAGICRNWPIWRYLLLACGSRK